MSGGGLYFDRKGQPIDMMTWARAMEDLESRIVAHTNLMRRHI